jgi:two-component system capsular synthesis sensor histidine kinase RcsC
MQGGILELASRPGEGSRFIVTLPFALAQQPETPVSGAVNGSTIPQFTGLHFLYVEDVASNREVMTAILEETGAILDMAETGSEAMQRLNAADYNVALIDLQLPDMDGMELATAIRSLHPALPLIAVTAQTSTATLEECRAAGMVNVVSKPVEPGKLFEAIAQCLRAGPEISTARLEKTFVGNPRRLTRVLATIAEELRVHRRDLERAFAKNDDETIRAVRHKLHSAMEELDLRELRVVLDQLASDSSDAEARARCLELFEETASMLAARVS